MDVWSRYLVRNVREARWIVVDIFHTRAIRLAAIFCLIVNDIYSYEREKMMGNRVMNTVRDIYENKECSNDFEAFQKSLRITNAMIIDR